MANGHAFVHLDNCVFKGFSFIYIFDFLAHDGCFLSLSRRIALLT